MRDPHPVLFTLKSEHLIHPLTTEGSYLWFCLSEASFHTKIMARLFCGED